MPGPDGGVADRVEELPLLIDCLQRAEAEARRRGLLADPAGPVCAPATAGRPRRAGGGVRQDDKKRRHL